MTQSTASAHTTPARVGGRALLVAVAVVTAILTLGLIVNDIVRIAYVYMGGYGVEAALISYEGVPADLLGADENNTAEVWKLMLYTHENVGTARMLQALAIALTTLTFVAGAITIILLCHRLWTGRTFAASAAVSVLSVAFLTITTAWVAPWLRHTADSIALAAMPFPTSDPDGRLDGDAVDRWVELPHYDIGSVDGAVLVLGVILALLALVYLGARRLQNDTEGLV